MTTVFQLPEMIVIHARPEGVRVDLGRFSAPDALSILQAAVDAVEDLCDYPTVTVIVDGREHVVDHTYSDDLED